MKCTLDSRGRVRIPKKFRDEIGLQTGTPVSIRCREGRIEIAPVTLSVRLVRKGPLLVAVPIKSTSRLTSQLVEKMRRTLHRQTTFAPTS